MVSVIKQRQVSIQQSEVKCQKLLLDHSVMNIVCVSTSRFAPISLCFSMESCPPRGSKYGFIDRIEKIQANRSRVTTSESNRAMEPLMMTSWHWRVKEKKERNRVWGGGRVGLGITEGAEEAEIRRLGVLMVTHKSRILMRFCEIRLCFTNHK